MEEIVYKESKAWGIEFYSDDSGDGGEDIEIRA